jgi:hypothetical protein
MEIKRTPQRSYKKGNKWTSIYKGDNYKIHWNKESKRLKLGVSNIDYKDKNPSRWAYDLFLTADDVQKIIETVLASISK